MKIDDEQLKTAIQELVTEHGVESFTRKSLRHKLEEKFELEVDSLLSRKDEIRDFVTDILAAPPPVKKKGKFAQQSTMMTKSEFLNEATPLETQLGHLNFEVKPRNFSTGSCGWWYGNKHEISVGDQSVTCQITINCTSK